MVEQIMDAIAAAAIRQFLDESGVRLSTSIQQCATQLSVIALPVRGQFDVNLVAQVLVAVLVANIPHEFEAPASHCVVITESMSEPKELSVLG